MPDKNLLSIGTSHDIIEGAPNRTLESAILIMGTKEFRRLPITKLGKIRGIITVTDIIRAIAAKGLPEAFNEEISDWMTKIPKTIDPDSSLKDATQMMAAGNFGSLLLVEHGSDILKGILTERDILNYYNEHDFAVSLSDLPEELLTLGLAEIPDNLSLEEAIKEMNNHKTHRILLKSEDGELTGILSANDITGLVSREREEINNNANFLKSINANFVATGDVSTVDSDSSVNEAIALMCSRNVGSIPVIKNGEVIGIFSERSLLHYIANYYEE